MKAQTISLSGRRKKKLEKQVEKYLDALQQNSDDHKLRTNLGDTYALLEDVKKSVKSYYSAIDLLRKAANIGKVRSQIIELYEKIIKVAPEDPRAYMELSEEYVAAGQRERAFRFLLSSAKKAYEDENYELALQCYNQTIAKGRTNPHIIERCTELYIKLGRKEEAMENYIHIGDMYAQEEKNIEALEYYKKACALDKDNPELVLKVARMYNAMAWTENAASELVKVGEFYERQRNFTEALRYYRYSVRLDPENEKAQDGRRRISESYTADGIPLTDVLEGEESEAPDVLEELESFEVPTEMNTGEVEATQGEFEITLLDDDLEATLTIEDDEPVEMDSGQVFQPEPEAALDLDATLSIEGNESVEEVSDQFIQPEPEVDLDLETISAIEAPEMIPMDMDAMLAIEGGSEIPEESSLGEQEASSDISLEDWIIDIKEGELVELALEEALREQEAERPEPDVGQIWGFEGEQDESAGQETSMLSLPPLGLSEGEMFVQEGQETTQIDVDVDQSLNVFLEGDQEEPESQETGGLLPDDDMGPRGDTERLLQEQQEVPEVGADVDYLNMFLEDDQGEAGSQETAGMFLEVEAEGPEEHEPIIQEEQEAAQSEASLDQSADMFLDGVQGEHEGQEDAGLFLEIDTEGTGEENVVFELAQEESSQERSEESDIEEPILSEAEGTVLSEDEESALRDVVSSVLRETEGEVQEEAEGHVLSEIEREFEEHEIEESGLEESGIGEEEGQIISFTEDVAMASEQLDQVLSEEEPVLSFTEEIPTVDEQVTQIFSEEEHVLNFNEEATGLQHRIDDLRQQLQKTEEEKYFLQEKFAAQVSRHKAREESLQREISDVYKDKEELEKQLQQVSKVRKVHGKSLEKFDKEKYDKEKYEALVGKIQGKRALLQQHLRKLLKKREENGRFLTAELDILNATKKRLQDNLEHFQEVKSRIEEKVNTELRQAKQEVQSLNQTAQYLESKLRAQQQVERSLRKQFELLNKEKDALQQDYNESMTTLTKENATLEKQLQRASKTKKVVEKAFRKKLQTLHRTYQQLKAEYGAALQAKETQLNESAQQLSEIADKYVKLERTLASIRKERDQLNKMLAQETATREMLEEKLGALEFQVESLEVEGDKLIKQIGQELDRHFGIEQTVSDKFQLSLEELEELLALQEKEIHSLEAL